jgi:hypothetical protein
MTNVRTTSASFAAAKAVAVARTSPFRDLRALNVLLALAVISAFVGYLVVNNQATAKGFAIRSLEKRIAQLEDRYQSLSIDVVSGQSMETIDSRIKGLGLVPVASVQYVTAAGGAVAVK